MMHSHITGTSTNAPAKTIQENLNQLNGLQPRKQRTMRISFFDVSASYVTNPMMM
jgi:hypothetical protein